MQKAVRGVRGEPQWGQYLASRCKGVVVGCVMGGWFGVV